MVTLAYIHSYVHLGPGNTKLLANGRSQKYYCCVDRVDNTCAVSIPVVIKEQEEIICCDCLHTNVECHSCEKKKKTKLYFSFKLTFLSGKYIAASPEKMSQGQRQTATFHNTFH